jgi:hypothetical protein
MAETENRDSEALSPRETAHLRARDRKRRTTMVVDNAGVKRILQARRDRAAARKQVTAGADSGTPGGSRTGGSSHS